MICGQMAIIINAIALWYNGYTSGEIATQMSFVVLLVAKFYQMQIDLLER